MARKSSARKAKAKARGKKRAGKKMMSFDKRVQAVVSRNIEDKYTKTRTQTSRICTQVNAEQGVISWFRFFPSEPNDPVGVWNMTQGVGQGQRTGNKIKVKKWLIKGLIQPDVDNASEDLLIDNSAIGYVTVYLGRLQSSNGAIGAHLTGLYQNGNTSMTPAGQTYERLYQTNTDAYKVYAKKTFKMGRSFSTGHDRDNNDFNLTAMFQFDVTKYVFKNRHISYDDTSPTPSNWDMCSLCVWAVFQPAVGGLAPFVPGIIGHDLGSYYSIQACSYGMYEDA